MKFDYKETGLNIVNNGHTIQENYASGSSMEFDGTKYNLLQFHFHTKTENMVNGKQYDVEMHIVHKDASGHLAVIGIFFKKGAKNDWLDKFWSKMPKDVDEPVEDDSIKFNATNIIPKEQMFWSFKGSLTTPPCTEGVNWIVMSKVLELSEEQYNKLHALTHDNNRPVQPLNGRKINDGR